MIDEKNRIRIGRAPECDVVIADASVSRVHAELARLPTGTYLLTDCHSSSGIFVRSSNMSPQRVKQEIVVMEDEISFGAVTLSMRELLSRSKFNSESLRGPGGREMASAAPSGSGPKKLSSADLVRCSCGAVKPKVGICPECKK